MVPPEEKDLRALSVAKFMSSSSLVANFPMEFALVPLESVKMAEVSTND